MGTAHDALVVIVTMVTESNPSGEREIGVRGDRAMTEPSQRSPSLDGHELCRLQQACQAFEASHRLVVALYQDGNAADPSAVILAVRKRDAALLRVRRCRADNRHGVLAKLDILQTLRKWLGEEDPRVGAFALHVTDEIAPFVTTVTTGERCLTRTAGKRWKDLQKD